MKIYPIIKRAIDVLVSGILLLMISPLFLLIAVLIKIEDRGPVFFLQERLGRGGGVFKLYKFRSMYVNPSRVIDHEIRKTDPDVTRVGKWIRRFKIDELPQLWSVLIGDLSLVGPRPGLPSHFDLYTPFQKRRLEIRGGLTGLAQVNGSIFLTWPERIYYDVEYIDNLSLFVDIKILLKTVLVVLLGEQRFLKKPVAEDGELGMKLGEHLLKNKREDA